MKIVIIGGGASGLVAAGCASRTLYEGGADGEIVVLEKNEKVGKKIYITGKGRCNVTNDIAPKDFLENVVSNPKFLSKAIYGFSPSNVVELLESNGTKTKVERGGRVFPLSDKASDVTKALLNFASKPNVNIITGQEVKSVYKDASKFYIKTNTDNIACDRVILCCGGKSYPATGSSGDGYVFSKKLGHTIVEPRPSLVPIELNEKVDKLMGMSLKNVSLSFDKAQCGLKGKIQLFGEMMFTDCGITGPIVLSLSSLINSLDYVGKKVEIDLKPALSESVLEERVLSDFKKYSNKQFKNALSDLLPRMLIQYFIEYTGIDENKFVNVITKEERKKMIAALKGLPFEIKGLYPIDVGIVTAGGVSVSEINPKTMESKLVNGLFFAGEVIDVDAFTGGFNLQIAFSTGYTAGKYAATVETQATQD